MLNVEESAHNTSLDTEQKNKAFFLVNSFLPLKQKILSSYKSKSFFNKTTEQEILTFKCPLL